MNWWRTFDITFVGQTPGMDDTEQLAACGRGLTRLLLASYGLHPDDLLREVRVACDDMGGSDVVVLLADYDQEELVAFDSDDALTVSIDGPGPGAAFRHEAVVDERVGAGRRRLWVPIKDSAERIGVLGIVDDGAMSPVLWESMASLLGELIVSKSKYGDRMTIRRRRRPFSLAAEMRWSMMPPLTYTSPDVTIAGFVQPSDRIAGDAFDYSINGRVASIAIFDAMGHGLEASRMANVAVGCYRATRRAGADLVSSLRTLDEEIAAQFGDSRFVTAQLATLDLDAGRLEIVNAGHPPPLRLRPDRPPDVIDCPPTIAAGLGSTPAVMVERLDRGDGVLFRSDGIVDARSPAGEFFGDERLADLVEELSERDTPPSEILRQAVHAIIRHQDGRPGDDATLVLMRWADDARLVTQPR